MKKLSSVKVTLGDRQTICHSWRRLTQAALTLTSPRLSRQHNKSLVSDWSKPLTSRDYSLPMRALESSTKFHMLHGLSLASAMWWPRQGWVQTAVAISPESNAIALSLSLSNPFSFVFFWFAFFHSLLVPLGSIHHHSSPRTPLLNPTRPSSEFICGCESVNQWHWSCVNKKVGALREIDLFICAWPESYNSPW